jgi:hypothetical protein
MTDDTNLPIPAGLAPLPTPFERLAEISQRRNLTAAAKEQAHPPSVPARHPALHAHAVDHHAGGIAPG